MPLLLLLLLALQSAGPAEEARQQGARLVAEADTLGALASLDASLAGGWTSPDAFLSLGHLHIARGEAGLAVLALERAARLAPTDPQVASARREAYALAGQAAPDVPPPFVAARMVASRMGAGALVAIALLLYLGVMTLLFAWWRRRERRLGWSAVALAPVALAALVLAGLALWDAGAPHGVALTAVEVRARPTPEADPVGQIQEGEVVATQDERSGWRRVEAGVTTGWVPSRAIEHL